MELAKPKATGDTKISRDTSQTNWNFPATKREAIDLQQTGARISLTEDMQMNLDVFFQDIGADNEVPTSREGKFNFFHNFHLKLAVNNPLWPEHLPFDHVYAAFLNAMMYGRASRNGNNVQAFAKAFEDWITKSGIKDKLYRKYYEHNPDQRPTPIAESSRPAVINEGDLLNQSPEEVVHQIKVLENMYGRLEEALKQIGGNTGKRYVDKLNKTFRHFKQKNYEE